MSASKTQTRRQSLKCAYQLAIAALGILFACSLSGCKGPSRLSDDLVESRVENRVPVSELQAKSIIQGFINRIAPGTDSIELSRPTLRKARYWCVIAKVEAQGGRVNFTNYISGAFSRDEAKALVNEATKATFEENKFSIQSVAEVEGYYWSIVVWRVPHVPESERLLFVSAKDGTVIDPSRIEPSDR